MSRHGARRRHTLLAQAKRRMRKWTNLLSRTMAWMTQTSLNWESRYGRSPRAGEMINSSSTIRTQASPIWTNDNTTKMQAHNPSQNGSIKSSKHNTSSPINSPSPPYWFMLGLPATRSRTVYPAGWWTRTVPPPAVRAPPSSGIVELCLIGSGTGAGGGCSLCGQVRAALLASGQLVARGPFAKWWGLGTCSAKPSAGAGPVAAGGSAVGAAVGPWETLLQCRAGGGARSDLGTQLGQALVL
jgi:hypothetical protein